MGIFDFVKEAGEKLFGDEPEQDLSAPISKAEIDEQRRKNIVRKINDLGLDVADLAVTVSGSTVKLEGTVADQECCEKVTLAAGNQVGIATVDCCLEVTNPAPVAAAEPAEATAAAAPQSVFYTVKAGDTLGAIAKAHYGNAGKYPVIFEANQPLLTDPNKIYPGQVLRIPPL